MATAYKILGQVQGISASGTQNINLFPDPNFERYTSDTHGSPTLGIWTDSGNHNGNTQNYFVTGDHQGAATSGRTNSVRFANHAGASQNGNRDYYWFLNSANRPYLDASKTYTLSLWYKHSTDNNSHHTGGGHAGHQIYYSKDNASNWTTIADNHSYSGTDVLGQNYYNTWAQHYATFAGTNSFFTPRIRVYNGNYNFWQYVFLDNIYLAEGAIPKALVPSKAPDGSTGNPNALHTSPFTIRSEGWSSGAYESSTIRRLTGSWQTLYTVPDLADASAVVSTLTVTNTGSVSATYRVAVVKYGETLANKHLVGFDVPVAPNSIETLTLGLTIGRQDRVLVQTDSDKVQFSLFGSENTL